MEPPEAAAERKELEWESPEMSTFVTEVAPPVEDSDEGPWVVEMRKLRWICLRSSSGTALDEAPGVPSYLREASFWRAKALLAEPNIMLLEDDEAPPLVKALE